MPLLRPYAVVLQGEIQLGLEVEIEGGVITRVGPQTGMPDPYVLSPAFVNAHSHFEYRGFQGQIDEPEYFGWIRELTKRKLEQTPDQVAADCLLAAQENVASGVAFVGEHTDRPGSAAAMASTGLRGVLFQEVITFSERANPQPKVDAINALAAENRKSGLPVHYAAHAYQTVDRHTLEQIGHSGEPFSMHVAETPAENELTEHGAGSLAAFHRRFGFEPPETGKRLLASLDDLGLVRKGAQFVHVCDVNTDEVALLASRGVTVAHCPRSNVRLRCPIAPVREMLDAGISVGLGLDSAASSGPIDFFAEMRACLASSAYRGRAVSPEETWRMATSMGYASLGGNADNWEIREGASVPLIQIEISGVHSIEEVIEQGNPGIVKRLA